MPEKVAVCVTVGETLCVPDTVIVCVLESETVDVSDTVIVCVPAVCVAVRVADWVTEFETVAVPAVCVPESVAVCDPERETVCVLERDAVCCEMVPVADLVLVTVTEYCVAVMLNVREAFVVDTESERLLETDCIGRLADSDSVPERVLTTAAAASAVPTHIDITVSINSTPFPDIIFAS